MNKKLIIRKKKYRIWPIKTRNHHVI